MQVQLFSSDLQAGNNELVAAVNAKESWPMAAVSVITPPDTKDVISLSARDGKLDGDVQFVTASEMSPQPHISLPDSGDTSQINAAENAAQFPIRIRDAGIYRLRLWCYWRTPASADLTLSMDGLPIKKNAGRDDTAFAKWHWMPLNVTADLGSGEHALAITGWKRGAMVGSVELVPAW